MHLLPPHSIYVEVFAGSAKLLFGKAPSSFEVMNDLNGEVTNFFRVAKHRPAELAERFEVECIHAGRFRDLLREPAAACEVDRALRFAYLAWYSFGGKGEHFASSSAKIGRIRRPLTRVRELLAAVAERLQSVQIEQRDFTDILDRYDAPETFFYLDPPYVHFQANGRYQSLTSDQRDVLFTRLAEAQGKFLMSFDDCVEIRSLAKKHGFKVRAVDVKYTISGGDHSKLAPAKELLLANYAMASDSRTAGANRNLARLHKSAAP